MPRTAKASAGANGRALTAKESKFALLYVLDPITQNNASASARKAGYQGGNVGTTAQRVIKKRPVAARILELQTELAESCKATAANIVERYRLIAMADTVSLLIQGPARVCPDTGDDLPGLWRYRTPDELSLAQRAMVADVTVSNRVDKATGHTVQAFSYRTHGVKESLDSLARINGLFRDRVEHDHSHTVRQLFKFVAANPARSETVARLDATHGRGVVIDAETIEPEK